MIALRNLPISIRQIPAGLKARSIYNCVLLLGSGGQIYRSTASE